MALSSMTQARAQTHRRAAASPHLLSCRSHFSATCSALRDRDHSLILSNLVQLETNSQRRGEGLAKREWPSVDQHRRGLPRAIAYHVGETESVCVRPNGLLLADLNLNLLHRTGR